jgi:hypothetical protein
MKKRKAADATASLNRRKLITKTRAANAEAAQRAGLKAAKRSVGAPRSPFNQWIAIHKILLRHKGEKQLVEQLSVFWGISTKAVKDAVKLGDPDARAFLIAVGDDQDGIQQNIDIMCKAFRELGTQRRLN